MRRIFTLGLVAVAALAGAADADVQVYHPDTSNSRIGFAVRHMMVATSRGHFDSFDGAITYDSDDMTKSSVEFTIDAASVNTSNDDRDEDLRGENFFNVEKFPHLTFKSTQIKKTDNGWVAVGDLTIRDVTKQVEIPFVLSGPIKNPWGGMVIGIEGGLEINRMDYGVKWNKTLDAGGMLVDETVKIEIALEAHPAKTN